MENRNHYFKPVVKDEKLYLKFYPAQEGGKKLDIKEVILYLNSQGYDEYDLKTLSQAVTSTEPAEVYIGSSMGNPFHEKVIISLSSDSMLVRCSFYPAAEGGRRITLEDVQDALVQEKIVHGIDEKLVSSLVQNREYCTEYLIGRGTPPTIGKDAKIEYFFSTNQSLKPKHNEDGTVNYHELNIISKVEKDQLLAKLIPAVPGKPGMDVLGNELKPRDVKNVQLSFSNNIRLSEDKTELYSEVTGHASLVEGKVFVSGVYEVPADVDNSVGDINYPGNVSIKGNVKSGFVVRADGDIVVEGVVEGAQLYAGGKIIVKRGIHGMGKGVLQAKGSVVIKFIESAVVKSGGYVETESIIHSKVSANTEINVSGGKGFIMGGAVRASSKISARTIGSEMGTATHIEVGMEPEKVELYAQLQQEAKEIAKKMETIRPILSNFSEKLRSKAVLSAEKVEFMKSQIVEFKNLQAKLATINEEINALRVEVISTGRAKVEVQNVIHPGVTIKISDASLTMKSDRKYCQFYKADGEVKIINL